MIFVENLLQVLVRNTKGNKNKTVALPTCTEFFLFMAKVVFARVQYFVQDIIFITIQALNI